MAAFGRILWRLIVVFVGLLFALAAAMIVLVVAMAQRLAPHMDTLAAIIDALLFGWFETLPVLIVSSFLALPIFVVAVLLAEGFRWRGWIYHAGVGTFSVASSIAVVHPQNFAEAPPFPTLLASGAVAGLVYWLVAGRSAGFFRPVSLEADISGRQRRASDEP